MRRHRLAQLVWSRKVGPSIYHQRFAEPYTARHGHAGQFVHLLPGAAHLFRRAFSIYATDPVAGTFDILHQALGSGTRCLARLSNGAAVDMIGPLGNRFPVPRTGQVPMLVGGGLGMAPLRFWAWELAQAAQRVKNRATPVMILGARSRPQATAPYGLHALGVRPYWATDDGSRGFHGNVVELLGMLLHQTNVDPAGALVCGCGPEVMMKALAGLCEREGIACHVSLERAMPCGFGVCMGCMVEAKGGTGYDTHRRVCRDGPVFDAATIVF